MDNIYYSIFIVWLGISGFLISIIGIVIYWGVKTKQFSNRDHASILPLISFIPEDEESSDNEKKT